MPSYASHQVRLSSHAKPCRAKFIYPYPYSCSKPEHQRLFSQSIYPSPIETIHTTPQDNSQNTHCLRRLASLTPISGLPLLLLSALGGTHPTPGGICCGLEYPPPLIGVDIAYAGALYGLTPVVISATPGSIWPPPLPIAIPPPIAASASPSPGLGGGTDLGVLSLRAAIVLDELLPLGALCAVLGRPNLELDELALAAPE